MDPSPSRNELQSPCPSEHRCPLRRRFQETQFRSWGGFRRTISVSDGNRSRPSGFRPDDDVRCAFSTDSANRAETFTSVAGARLLGADIVADIDLDLWHSTLLVAAPPPFEPVSSSNSRPETRRETSRAEAFATRSRMPRQQLDRGCHLPSERQRSRCLSSREREWCAVRIGRVKSPQEPLGHRQTFAGLKLA